MANIVSDTIVAMAPLFAGYLAPGGRLVTSGIILPRAQEVTRALEGAGFLIDRVRDSDEWAAVDAHLRG